MSPHTLFTYMLNFRDIDPLNRFPRYQATAERMAVHVPRAADREAQNVALDELWTDLYPGLGWQSLNG